MSESVESSGLQAAAEEEGYRIISWTDVRDRDIAMIIHTKWEVLQQDGTYAFFWPKEDPDEVDLKALLEAGNVPPGDWVRFQGRCLKFRKDLDRAKRCRIRIQKLLDRGIDPVDTVKSSTDDEDRTQDTRAKRRRKNLDAAEETRSIAKKTRVSNIAPAVPPPRSNILSSHLAAPALPSTSATAIANHSTPQSVSTTTVTNGTSSPFHHQPPTGTPIRNVNSTPRHNRTDEIRLRSSPHPPQQQSSSSLVNNNRLTLPHHVSRTLSATGMSPAPGQTDTNHGDGNNSVGRTPVGAQASQFIRTLDNYAGDPNAPLTFRQFRCFAIQFVEILMGIKNSVGSSSHHRQACISDGTETSSIQIFGTNEVADKWPLKSVLEFNDQEDLLKTDKKIYAATVKWLSDKRNKKFYKPKISEMTRELLGGLFSVRLQTCFVFSSHSKKRGDFIKFEDTKTYDLIRETLLNVHGPDKVRDQVQKFWDKKTDAFRTYLKTHNDELVDFGPLLTPEGKYNLNTVHSWEEATRLEIMDAI